MNQTDIQRVVDALPEPTVLLGRDGLLAYYNQPASERLGLTRLGQPVAWRLTELDRSPLPEDPIARALDSGTLTQRRVLLNASQGRLLETQVRVVPLRGPDDSMRGVMVSFTDLSQLVSSDSKEYQLYFDLSDDFLAVSTTDGRILRINEGATRLLGWPREAYLGSVGLQLLHPDDRGRSFQVLSSGVAQHDFITRLKHADGSWRLMSWTMRPGTSPVFGEVVYMRGVDVTEKLRREEELVASREQLAEAQDIARIGTFSRELRTGALELSLRARQMFELPDGQTAAQVLASRFPPEQRLEQLIDRAVRGETSAVQVHLALPSGQRDYKLWTRPNRDPAGQVVRVVGVVQDVTEEVQRSAQLRLAERLASVGTLAAGVAHEINNPLAFIVANLNTVRSELSRVSELPSVDLNDLRSALAEASEGAERVRTIVAGLRAFTRVDETSVTLCDVRRVLDAVLNLSRNEIRHRARLSTEFGEVPLVLANEARLGQVFLNLILNAAQAISDGHADGNTITLVCRAEGEQVVVLVRDTGAGISPAHLPRIFDPFFTTKGTGSGTGLGLFIAQGIVRELGGDLKVSQTGPGGTTFRVSLPAAPHETPAVTPPTGTAVARPAGLKVLVVDDEPLILRSLQRMLGRTHQVTVAQGGRAALEQLAAAPFDLVLCDLMMPDFSGMQLYEALTEAQRKILVFMSGGTFTEDARAFLARYQPPMLAKPFTPESVTTLLRSAGTRS